MKILVNSKDAEIAFTNLDGAKFYYCFTDFEIADFLSDYNGYDKINYNILLKKYNNAINETSTLQELANVLNEYTDVLDNGSYYNVREI